MSQDVIRTKGEKMIEVRNADRLYWRFLVGMLSVILLALTSCSQQLSFSSLPSFSVQGFDAITDGMAEEDVRDLIGPPIRRYLISGMENYRYWEYSWIGTVGKPWVSYRVTFDQNGFVVGKQDDICSDSTGKLRPFKPKCPDQTPNIQLGLADGGTVRLGEERKGLIFVETFSVDSGPWRWKHIKEHLKFGPDAKSFQILLVNIDPFLVESEIYCKESPWPIRMAHDPNRELLQHIPGECPYRMVLLDEGFVVPFHDVVYVDWGRDDYLADLLWTIRNVCETSDNPRIRTTP